jgi:hypothetical protein
MTLTEANGSMDCGKIRMEAPLHQAVARLTDCDDDDGDDDGDDADDDDECHMRFSCTL